MKINQYFKNVKPKLSCVDNFGVAGGGAPGVEGPAAYKKFAIKWWHSRLACAGAGSSLRRQKSATRD
jgi:hypothetical protein